MTDKMTADELRQELQGIDDALADLRRVNSDAQSRRGEDGDSSEGYQESEDVATELTGINENEAVIDVLQQRRDMVEARLKALG
jgi:hypothetical protein